MQQKEKGEQVSSYIFVLWCKWEKKLRGIIKMSLAFHLTKIEEMREEVKRREGKLITNSIYTNRKSRFLFFFFVRK